jgi:hypothetical protein
MVCRIDSSKEKLLGRLSEVLNGECTAISDEDEVYIQKAESRGRLI